MIRIWRECDEVSYLNWKWKDTDGQTGRTREKRDEKDCTKPPTQSQLMRILASGVRVLWQQWTNSRRLQKSCGKKGKARPLSKWERGREGQREHKRAWPLPGQAFIAFLGILHRGWSSFTMHRFTVDDYLLQITKRKNVANYFKEKDITDQEGKWWNWLHSILVRFSTDFRKLKILSKHLLPQSRVREF